eukprot:365620-Chlamydomonas_euryale.AAC.5
MQPIRTFKVWRRAAACPCARPVGGAGPWTRLHTLSHMQPIRTFKVWRRAPLSGTGVGAVRGDGQPRKPTGDVAGRGDRGGTGGQQVEATQPPAAGAGVEGARERVGMGCQVTKTTAEPILRTRPHQPAHLPRPSALWQGLIGKD